MRRVLAVVLLVLALPATARAGQGTAPSCGELRTGFRVVYSQALEASKGKARFSRCYRTRGAGTAAVVRITGSAPQVLRVRMWPMSTAKAPDYWFSARTATAADQRAARGASRDSQAPTLKASR